MKQMQRKQYGCIKKLLSSGDDFHAAKSVKKIAGTFTGNRVPFMPDFWPLVGNRFTIV